MRDVIDTIDNAIDDWKTSSDAMRWRPRGGAPPAPPMARRWWGRPPYVVTIRASGWPGMTMTAVPSGYTAAGRRPLLRRGFRPADIVLDEAWPVHPGQRLDLTAHVNLGSPVAPPTPAPPAPAAHGVVSPRVPTYRDSRPRWQSPYG